MVARTGPRLGARLSEWFELSFWQIAVRVLTTARPLSHGLAHTRELIEGQPATQFLPHGWVTAGAGWLLGLVVGLWMAGLIF
jgi:hypothetical protein